jgi:hypothetical protein
MQSTWRCSAKGTDGRPGVLTWTPDPSSWGLAAPPSLDRIYSPPRSRAEEGQGRASRTSDTPGPEDRRRPARTPFTEMSPRFFTRRLQDDDEEEEDGDEVAYSLLTANKESFFLTIKSIESRRVRKDSRGHLITKIFTNSPSALSAISLSSARAPKGKLNGAFIPIARIYLLK